MANGGATVLIVGASGTCITACGRRRIRGATIIINYHIGYNDGIVRVVCFDNVLGKMLLDFKKVIIVDG